MKVLFFVVALLLAAPSFANEWRQFRGPDGQGHADEARNLPTAWSETENIIWKAEIPGRGWSSPVFADSTIWLTTAVEKLLTGEALEKAREEKLKGNPVAKQMDLYDSVILRAIGLNRETGKVEQDIELFAPPALDAIHSQNSFASPSPILDGDFLYCHFGEMGTACVNTKTDEIVWTAKLPSKHSVGPGSSPVIYENLLIVNCDGTEQQYVIALDKLTGEQVWRTNRPKLDGDNGDLHKAFSTPLIVRSHELDQVIIPGAQWVVSYNPKNGQEIWRVGYGAGFSNVPRPIIGHGMAYICTGFMNPQIFAIRLGGEGDITESHVTFKIPKQAPATPSPILVDQQLYFISDQGVATSVDALTGKSIWTKRISGNFSSSPLFADGKIYFSSHEGKTTIIHPGPMYDEVAVNSLDAQLMASPAVLDESLIFRSQSHVYRIGTKTGSK